jgi:hypothetical protein
MNETEYALSLNPDSTIESLTRLVGKSFPVEIMGSDWGRVFVEFDELVVTRIEVRLSLHPSTTTTEAIHIYCDYRLNAKTVYNAWIGLEQFQRYLGQSN